MSDLFSSDADAVQGPVPLAERLRPKTVEEVIGQAQLLAPEAPLGAMLASGQLTSLIFWGPPGVGKTTLARLLADHTDLFFEQISAIFSGVADLKKCFEAARLRHKNGRGTLLFVDEIHRFNRAQQDGFLPYIEDGSILLVGASTENPSFELNAALLSRAQVLVLTRLADSDLRQLMARAEAVLNRALPLTAEAKELLITMADGDGRMLLNLIEQTLAWPVSAQVSAEALAKRLSRRASQYDKSGDGHYNLISALHKSVRGSDPDAALYWLARMLEGARIHVIWGGAYYEWRSKILVWQIWMRNGSALRPGKVMSDWAARKVSWRLRKRWLIWRWRLNRTRFIALIKPPAAPPRAADRCPLQSIF